MNAYEKAGVNIAAGETVVTNLQQQIKKLNSANVLGGLGAFGGLYQLPPRQQPVLVAGTDGVGTKLLLAIQSGRRTTVGQDLVAMCVNDVVAQGAQPLFFLDYLAVAQTQPQEVAELMQGIVAGCQQSGMTLLGGETAEMPDMYTAGHYDLAGFAVGIAEKAALLTPEQVQAGDILLGLPASGLHSNGFSLVRQLLFKTHDYRFTDTPAELGGANLLDTLLTPTQIYVDALLPLLKQQLIAGAAHITGGGLLENVPRMLPAGLTAQVNLGSWPRQPIFDWLCALGQLQQNEAFTTFNMGLGMVLAIHPTDLAAVQQILTAQQQAFYQIGTVHAGATGVVLVEADA
ncbi:phosphoribosylformylglycinamidine cyclo-ligase [Loigolactobacillus coryniformis]|uniref:Phosphoribosylformylglycinamidine cyclo-ligase n=3 Tax=Loigolactobacillus coryniformis TaxID=1610 RepID=A0A2D1KNL1_9LACO|nr:phosphoribosylformylglycinamidine cyclo-ligase [Loigolactobacillus coryniformis]ATO43642.1 phosphoribosylformylglycinamidine cyclo-ligase [Loigolactobacillus coryniformis subsp. torquens DSM 20004 = KCTC 3535]KRK83896.1 phosphoribosylaminoimidazole synthetase [Loigolactobacillus coryniformis subsp. torquens DSM 20004 = KCTC 3535]MCL5458221.1 phosphoribosylformylglycinamidine cyclo-ligase [Loigolactobacillus coryniformis]